MNNVFLDCGANNGQAYDYFSKIYPDTEWEYHLFEPNPNCCDFLKERYLHKTNIKIYDTAAYINETPITFSFSGGYDVGGTIIQQHNNGYGVVRTNEKTIIPVNIVTHIQELKKQNKNVILKLDVESSEYDIMEVLISSKTIFLLQKIYCEFHSMYFNTEDRMKYLERENNILKFINSNKINFDCENKFILISEEEYYGKS